MDQCIEMKKIKKYAWAGIIATFMLMVGDYLLEYTVGLETRELGMGVVNTAWKDMASWRFTVSAWLGAFAMPLELIGCWGLKLIIEKKDKKWAKRIWYICAAGICGGDFIHIVLCLLPIGWQAALAAGEEIATAAIDAQAAAILFPFYFYYTLLFIIAIVLTIATFKGKTPFYKWQMLLCPHIFLIIGGLAVNFLGDMGQWLYVGSASRGMMMMYILTFWAAGKYQKTQKIK